MRNLASICTIKQTWSLEGKDRVQGASFVENGYDVMIGKDLKVGDKVVFIQEGSILPVEDKWEFLRKRCYKKCLNGFLITPQKFGTIKSWGLTISLSDAGIPESMKSGDDVTELLNIRKYEPEEEASPTPQKKHWFSWMLKYKTIRWLGAFFLRKIHPPKASGNFPTNLISKSDETTIQNNPSVIEKFADEKVYVSAKMEGQSVTVIPVFKRNKLIGLYPCSRNQSYPTEISNTFWNTLKQYDLLKKMQDLYNATGKAYIIQAEQCGPGIQGNIYNFPKTTWFVYTIKEYKTLKQLNLGDARIISARLGLNFVPVLVENLPLKMVGRSVEELVAVAESAIWYYDKAGQIISELNVGDRNIWKDCLQHEGVVVRSMNCDKDNNIGVSFKVKNIQYAEKGLGKIFQIAQQLKNK